MNYLLISFANKSNMTFQKQVQEPLLTVIKRLFKATERTGGGPLRVDKVDTNTGIGRIYYE